MSSSTDDRSARSRFAAEDPLRPRPAVCLPDENVGLDTAFGCPRNFLGRRHVYLVISPRARGLSVGVNFNPDRECNFDCVYCEVDRRVPLPVCDLNIHEMARELEEVLQLVDQGGLQQIAPFDSLPAALKTLKHVTISGDGEPTLCRSFLPAVEAITHLRTAARAPFFRLVLITNATGLDLPEVRQALKQFTPHDEIWAKLDVGTQAGLEVINRTLIPLDKILANILLIGRERPVVIQSLFTAIAGRRLPEAEIAAYAHRLKELKDAGADIPLVQIYSANRPSPNAQCRHLDLRELSGIARQVRAIAGLNAEVF